MTTVNLAEALDRAIAAEATARAFYLDAAERTRNSAGAAMFRELADFEGHHEERLKALKTSLAAGGPWITYDARALLKTPPAEAGPKPAVTESADAIEAVRIAIGAEEKAEAEYRALARAAGDPKGSAMFERLAAEEAMHRKLLDDQYYSLTNRGLWVWGD